MVFASRMKTKTILGCFVAMLIAVCAISTILAADLDINSMTVSVDDSTSGIVASPGETMPVRVEFISNQDVTDAKVKVWISGYKDDIEASTERFDVIAGKTYVKKFSLEVPGVADLEDFDEDLTLHVEVSDKNDDYETEYALTVEKESYDFSLLSIDAPTQASAGDIVAIDVVLKNIGRKSLDDVFVVASISELGLSKKVYFGDIAPEDNFDDDDDSEDAVEKRIYLVIPSDAESGEYSLKVKASNYDTESDVVKSITVKGATATDDGKTIDTTGDKNTTGIPSSVIVLTVVLVIVFLVLLIVLIVLLTKKPEEKIEDFGETSYY